MTARRDILVPALLVVCAAPFSRAADPGAPALPEAPAPADMARIAQLFDEKKYDDALAALGSPGSDLPASPYEALAKGTTLAAAGKLDDAAQVLQALATSATDPSIAHRARFNLGSVRMRQSDQAPPEKLDDRMKLVSEAADQFLAAARLDPSDLDAVRNLEHARKKLADLQRQQQEQQKQQQQEQDQSGEQDQNKDQQQQQGDQSNQDGQQGEQQNQDQNQQDPQNQQNQQSKENPQSKAQQAAKDLQDQAQKQAEESLQNHQNQQSNQQGAKDQQELSEQAEKSQQDLEALAQEQQKDQKESERSDQNIKQAQDALERARKAQEDAERALEKGDQKEAAEKQHEAAQALQEAATNTQQAANALDADAQAQVDPLIQQLLDREKAFRAQRARALKGTPVPVDKDW